MKSLFFAATVAVSLIATQACAGTITSELRFGNPSSTGANFTEYKLDSSVPLPFDKGFNLGSELTVKQSDNQGPVTGKLTGRLEYGLSDVVGFKPTIYGEYGNAFAAGHNFSFVGAGAKVSRPLVNNINVDAGFRRRQDVESNVDNVENRYNVGVSYDIMKDTTLGLEYYRINGTSTSNVIGIVTGRKF
jgi:hypothetical protein